MAAIVNNQMKGSELTRETGLSLLTGVEHRLWVLYYQQGGYCLWSKRLERGTFQKSLASSIKQMLNAAQLQCLIDGIYWQKANKTDDIMR